MRNEKHLYITTKDGSIIGKLRERDGISDCKLTEKQNDNSTLTFNMLTSSEKYPLLANPENLIVAGERVFSAIYDGDSLSEKKDSGNKNTAAFSFVERQCLLDKVRVTAYNSTTTYDHIDTGMVVILSGGIAPLTVNGVQLSCPYSKGTAAYALYAVLHGTDWSVGTVDVDGNFDLETDKKSVLENVKAIHSLWGGILIFDSLERKIHLRSEEIYRPYSGYGVRFKFNETGLERTVNRNIITRLYVYGKDNLNIAASNDGKEYLENYSYTSTPLCGVMVNNDITNAGDLIVWGKRELEKVCKPQVTLKLSLIDRSQIEGGVSFDVSDIIDVVDEDLSASKYQARVTEKSYSYFQPWECTVTLGDEKEVFAAKIKYVMENAEKVNDLLDLFNRISSDDINMSGTKQSMTSYVQLTNEALEAGFKVIGVDGYERTGKTKISIDGIDVYNGGIVVRDRQNDIKIYMDGQTGNIIFSGDLYGASGTFSGALEAATGTFSGELKAATGSFEGDITAKNGYIGSWQILDGGIINKNNSLALTAEGEIIAANGNFQVDKDGKLTAVGAEITGDFSASSGGSEVRFTKDDMLIYFAGYNESTELITNECKISPDEFYFYAYDESGGIKSGIAYNNGQLEIMGKITAASGEIGGWLIEDDKIKAKNGTMVLYADGTIEGCDSEDEDGSKLSGSFVSKTGDEKTVIKGGRITMYHWSDELNDGYGGWEAEGTIYTNSLFGGGLCLSSVNGRPIVFAVGGFVVAKIVPAETDEKENIIEDTHFVFRGGTKIYREKITTKNVEFTDSPLLTDAQDVVGAINELFQGGSEGGDDWHPPEWWITVPEPEAYEMYFLVHIRDTFGAQIALHMARPEDANTGYGSHTIDWGDGTVKVYEEENGWHEYHGHTYGDTGQYLIKVSADKNSCFLIETGNMSGTNTVPVIKLGAEIVLNNDDMMGAGSYAQNPFRHVPGLFWVVIKNKKGLPRTQAFENCKQLKRVDMAVPPEVITSGTFYGCEQLEKFDFSRVKSFAVTACQGSGFKKINAPLCTTIDAASFSECHGLMSVNAPLCTSVGSSAFINCYALREAILAEDCSFGGTCFESCYSLYPRPDGATI